MLEVIVIVGIFVAGLIYIMPNHKSIYLLTILHALIILGIGLYGLSLTNLPYFYWPVEKYFLLDHVVVFEIILTGIVFLCAALYSLGYLEGLIEVKLLDREDIPLFYIAMNLLITISLLAFFSNNLALFWIFAELTTIFSAILVIMLNAKENIEAGLKYIFVTSSCMLFAFIGIMLLLAAAEPLNANTLNWNELMVVANLIHPVLLSASFIFIFVGFAAKSGVAPFHTWLPHAHSKAPSVVSVIISSVVLNVSIFGLIRLYAIVRQTALMPVISQFLLIFGLGSIAIAGFTMLQQKDLKTFIAFSSVEQSGFILVILAINTPLAIFWLFLQIFAQSLAKALLFFSAGHIHHQYATTDLTKISDLFQLQPMAAWGLVLGSVIINGMPPFAVFIAKIGILLELMQVSNVILLILLLLFVIVAAAFANLVIQVVTKRSDEKNPPPTKSPPIWGMQIPIVLLLGILFVLGIFIPQPLIDLLNNIIAELM